jgi:hypothetical protein
MTSTIDVSSTTSRVTVEGVVVAALEAATLGVHAGLVLTLHTPAWFSRYIQEPR